MNRKAVSGIMLTFLLTSMALTLNIQLIKAERGPPWGGNSLWWYSFLKYGQDYDNPRVLFDMLHVEQFAFWRGYSKLSSQLRSEGYVLYQLGREAGEWGVGELTYDLLTNFDILVLPTPQCVNPTVQFKTSEVEAIIEFVRNGGGLLVLEGNYPQYDNWYSVKDVIMQFGIEYEIPITELDSYVTNIIPHSITGGIHGLLIPYATALNVSSPAEAIAYSQGKPVVAVSEYENGRIVVISSGHMFCLDYIQQYDNLAFALNVFQWLSETGIEYHPLELPLSQIENWSPPFSMIVGKVYRVDVEIQNYGVAPVNVTVAILEAPVFNETGYCRGNNIVVGDARTICIPSNTSGTTSLNVKAIGIGCGTKEEVKGYTYMSIIVYTSFYSSYLVSDGQYSHDIPVTINEHEISLISLELPSTEIYVGQMVNITAVVKNYGTGLESFNVSIHCNNVTVQTIPIRGLNFMEQILVTFNWNTTILTAYTNYTLKVAADIVEGEADTENNEMHIILTTKMMGDINGDGKVNIVDIAMIATKFGKWYGIPDYDRNCDLNLDNKINIVDIAMAAKEFGKKWP